MGREASLRLSIAGGRARYSGATYMLVWFPDLLPYLTACARGKAGAPSRMRLNREGSGKQTT